MLNLLDCKEYRHLDSIRITIEDNGSLFAPQDYDPWGKITRSWNPSTPYEKFKFTGKELDSETEYHYFGARYYDSFKAQWTSPDPLEDKYPGWNTYCYAHNNGITKYDPDGRAVHWAAVLGLGLIGAAVDFTSQMAINMADGKTMGEAFNNVDWTSVGTSFISTASGAGITNTGLKLATIFGAESLDAMVDYHYESGFRDIFGYSNQKSYTKALTDGLFSVIGHKLPDEMVEGLKKYIKTQFDPSIFFTDDIKRKKIFSGY